MSNQILKLHSSYNPYFCMALFKWFSNGVFPVELSRLQPKDLKLAATDDQLTGMKVLFVWILPGLLLAAGAVLLIRRKRK
jgi:ABC-2 type transport system permease protein